MAAVEDQPAAEVQEVETPALTRAEQRRRMERTVRINENNLLRMIHPTALMRRILIVRGMERRMARQIIRDDNETVRALSEQLIVLENFRIHHNMDRISLMELLEYNNCLLLLIRMFATYRRFQCWVAERLPDEINQYID